jgi:hypothetical protein
MDDDVLGTVSVSLFGPVRATRGRVEVALGGPKVRLTLACALAELGQAGEALRWGEHAIASDSTLEHYVSCALARLGEGESALHTLSHAIAQGWSHADWLRHDPDWSTLRSTPDSQSSSAALHAGCVSVDQRSAAHLRPVAHRADDGSVDFHNPPLQSSPPPRRARMVTPQPSPLDTARTPPPTSTADTPPRRPRARTSAAPTRVCPG